VMCCDGGSFNKISVQGGEVKSRSVDFKCSSGSERENISCENKNGLF
jgi:hypothetical protein